MSASYVQTGSRSAPHEDRVGRGHDPREELQQRAADVGRRDAGRAPAHHVLLRQGGALVRVRPAGRAAVAPHPPRVPHLAGAGLAAAPAPHVQVSATT